MKRALTLLGLVVVWGCSFPDYNTGNAGGGPGGSGSPGTGAEGGASAGSGGGTPTAPSCKDGERNGDETGIDCGMAACSKPCPPGQGCDTDPDCDGGKCQDKICQAESCGDGLQNNTETDKDCGGDQGCTRCMAGQLCSATSDCDGGLCTNGQCQAPSCKDLLQNGAETDIDCGGGSCDPCEPGGVCLKTDDCDNVLCTRGKCQPAACDDKLLNQDETDLDCGGSCAPCADTLKCSVAADCRSGVCPKTQLCAAPSCSDKVQNGNESAVDCGGSCAKKCELLRACGVGTDCQSTRCVSQRCVPLSATGTPLSPVGWTAAAPTLSTSATTYAFDGLQGTNWISGADQVPGMAFVLDMKTDQVVFSIEMDCNDTSDPDPEKTDIAESLNVAFGEDPSFTGVTPVIMSRTITAHETITFPEPQIGRYIKFSLAFGKSRWWRIDEIRVKQ